MGGEDSGWSSARRLAEDLFQQLLDGTRDARAGVTRASYGDGEQFAHELVARHAARAGLEVDRDAALNTYMTLPGRDRSRPRIVIGSHLDSVACGGNFDGAAGVVAGLAALHVLRTRGYTPAQDVTVMGVRAEESAWFPTSYIGSKAALGRLEPQALEVCRVDTGESLEAHIRRQGGDPEALRQGQAHLRPADVAAYLELHIEQAPSLVERGHALAIGTAVPGNVRYPVIRVQGEMAHVGLPRRFRRDALKAAAAFVAELEGLWAQWEARGCPMAFTVGRFHTDAEQEATTKVPGDVRFSVDLRAYDEDHVRELDREARACAARLEQDHGVSFDFGVRTTAAVAKADAGLVSALSAIAREEGIVAEPLLSPASHDAAVFCAAGIPMAMLFIRNENGSHNPHERMDIDDFMAGVRVLTGVLCRG